MNSRMDKYQADVAVKERSERNRKLYDDLQEIDIDYIDINVDNSIELSPSNNKATTREEYMKKRELEKILPTPKIEIEERVYKEKEDRIYNINDILKLARENRLFVSDNKKRLIDTEYNILTKLDIESIENNEELSKENLRALIDGIYQSENAKKPKKEDNRPLLDELMDKNINRTQSKSLEDTIRSIIIEETTKQMELKERAIVKEEENNSEVLENNNTSVVKKRCTDNSIEFEIEEEKGKGLLVVIIILAILLIGAVGYLVLDYLSLF